MTEFSAQDAIRSPYDPQLQGRAVRLCLAVAILLVAVAAIGYGNLAWFKLADNPLLVLLAVGGPIATAVALVFVAAIIAIGTRIGPILLRFAAPIFFSAVAGALLAAWGGTLLFSYVERMSASAAAQERAIDGIGAGAMSIQAIQVRLLSSRELAANQTALYYAEHSPDYAQPIPYPAQRGMLAPLAYIFWPLQFQIVRDVISLVGIITFISVVAMFGIWWERKVAGRIQSRMGPMRVGGWHGWAQSLADGIKLLQKEDIALDGADKPLFRLAPYLAFVPAVCVFIALPFSTLWVFRDLDVGLIFILAMIGIGVVGVLLAGWASNNKWSVYGAMREACQMVSYEIPMGMALLVPVMTVGSLKLTTIGNAQAGGFHTWLAFTNPFTFLAAGSYFLASLASCKRAPFDLPEAESELVSGYHTEYSGFRFSLFFFAEYAEMYAVCALATILFFGAWHSPLPSHWAVSWWGDAAQWTIWQRGFHGILFDGPIWLVLKSFFLIYVQIWIRWTLPRIRLDQVMYACVQVLLPMTMVVLLGNTIWELAVSPRSLLGLSANVLMTAIGGAFVLGFIAIMCYGFINRRQLVGTLAIDALPGS